MGPKAPQGQTLIQAEHRALRGEVESQDSQLFLERYHQKYAPGLRSSSPSQPLPPEVVRAQVQQYPRSTKVHQKSAGVTGTAPTSKPDAKTARPKPEAKTTVNPRGRSAKDNPAKDKGLQHTAGAADQPPGGARTRPAPGAFASRNRHASSSQSSRHLSGRATLSRTVEVPEPEPAIEPQAIDGNHPWNEPHARLGTVDPSHLIRAATDDDDVINGRNLRPPTHVSVSSTTRKKPRARLRFLAMEMSQSPTQSNGDRSYEQYLPRGDDLIPTDSPEELEPVPQHSEHTSNSQNDNRSLHDDDTRAVNFGNLDRYTIDLTAPVSSGAGEPAHGSPGQLIGYPETPAPHKSLFAGSKAYLLPSSQMFGQTQVSSALKAFSPTSSRPSPDNLQQLQDSISPNGIISSPSKNIRGGPSPLQCATSSPHSLPPHGISPKVARHGSAASDDDTTNAAPFQQVRKPPAGLMGSYRPIHKLQDPTELSPQLVSETDSDDDASYDNKVRRRHRAMSKRMAAEKTLKTISYERPFASEDVVVPSTSTRRETMHKTDAQRYHEQCEKAREGSRDAVEEVEDSQNAAVLPAVGRIGIQQVAIDGSQAGVLLLTPEHASQVYSNVGAVLDTLPNTARSPTASQLAAEDNSALYPLNGSNGPRQGGADAVPETSPARLRPLGEMLPHSSDEDSGPESIPNLLDSSWEDSSSSSEAPRPPRFSHRRLTQSPGATVRRNISQNTLPSRSTHVEMVGVTQRSPVDGSSPPPLGSSTRARLHGKHGHNPNTSPEGSSALPAPAFTRARLYGKRSHNPNTGPEGSSVSTLSVLSTTPIVSDTTTPWAQVSPANTIKVTSSSSGDPQTSPAVAKANRRGNTGAKPKPKPTAAPRKGVRNSTRSSSRSFLQHAATPIVDLTRSPSPSAPRAFEQSAMLSRLGRTSLRELPASRETSRGGGAKILAGMAFAISFQSRQPGEKESHYNSRMDLLSKIGDKIKQAGGKVLTRGFDQLFEFAGIKEAEVASSTPQPDGEIKLTTAARNIGFTALIADGHSRKVKYMQALALGLPCIHERWITACVEKQKLVNWSDYLLCAGSSSLLGNAIRSRNLPSYDVASAKLSKVIENRPRLLDKSRILLVLRKQDEGKKGAYVFLARVLGASLSRVYNLDEARGQLKASKDSGYPYDWVYVEDKMAARADLFSDGASTTAPPPTALATSSKKRKRQSEVHLAAPTPKKIRVLSDELVIQSLIVGRLLEEGEMGYGATL